MKIVVSPNQAERDRLSTRSDAVFASLKGSTPADIDAWIDANVNNLAQARRVLKALLKLAVLQLRGTM